MPTVNIRAFSHKKSTVVENGGPKLPTAAQLELGEIAINFAKGYETLSIKNNNDEIVTFTNDNYWINKELAIAAALNDLNDRKQDALGMDEIPTEGSENVVTSGGLYSYITEIEQVTAAALNDLNDRVTSLALSDDYAAAAQGTHPLAGDTYETAISKLHKVIIDDELITSSALNDLNSRIDNLSLSEDYEATDIGYEPASGDTYEEAISKLHGAILENELATSAALNDLDARISDIVVPEVVLSEDYEPSSLSNLDLFLEPGDSYEIAFSKLEKTINDNENITSAALTDLDSRLNLLHLPQSLDDIPDGSPRKLFDYATTTSVNSSLATKQDALVSGTNIKTINNESILGSGNITIQGGGTTYSAMSQAEINAGTSTTERLMTPKLLRDNFYTETEVDDLLEQKQNIDLIVTVTDIDNDSGTTNYSVSEISTQIQAGRNVYIRFNTLQLPLVFSSLSKLIYAMTVASDSVTSLNLPPTILSIVLEGTTATFYLFPFNSVAFTGVDIPIEEISESLLDSTLTPGIYKVTGSNASTLNTEYPYIVIVGSFKTTFIDMQGTTTTNYISQTRVRGNGVFYRSKDITNDGEWTSWESILSLLESRINTLETNVAYTADLANVATSGSYNDLTNKPTIPAAVTESTVAGWGFTKNTGTVTGVKINGTTNNPTNGVVDLGTVLTTETDPTVPAWAKAANKPTYTAAEVGALPDTYTPPVTSVNGQTGAVNLTIPSAPGTLNTTATTAQSTSSSEALSGNITLHKVAKTGTYNDLIGKPTIPTVNNATLTIQKNGTTVNTFTANASSNVTANIEVNELPTVSSSDNGKVLQVVNGAWALVTPTAIYSGTSAPNNAQGNNGDLYLQTN